MTEHTPFDGPADDTEERIMRATFRTLRRYGYAGLSIGRIAEESELSKSSVYHFYDGKEDLLASFLDFMIDQWRAKFAFERRGDPVEALRAYLTYAVTGTTAWVERADPDGDAFFGQFVELRAQAVTNEVYRRRFSRFDEVFLAELASIVEAGIEAGVFRETDPDRAAELVLTLVMGAVLRRTTVDEFDAATVDEAIDAVLDCYLLAAE